jgi:hypothetical protein
LHESPSQSMIPAETDSRFSLRKFGHVLTGIAPTVVNNSNYLIESIFLRIKIENTVSLFVSESE